MKNALAKYFLGFFGASVLCLQVLQAISSSACGPHAKRRMKPMLWKHTMQRKAKLHIAPWGTASLWFWYTA